MAARHAQTWSIWSFLLFLWLFLTNGTLYQSSKTVKTVKNSQTTVKTEKNDHWCTNRHMSTQSPPNTRVHKAAQTPLPCETSITCAWAVATASRPWTGLTVCVDMDVHASGSRSLPCAATLSSTYWWCLQLRVLQKNAFKKSYAPRHFSHYIHKYEAGKTLLLFL